MNVGRVARGLNRVIARGAEGAAKKAEENVGKLSPEELAKHYRSLMTSDEFVKNAAAHNAQNAG